MTASDIIAPGHSQGTKVTLYNGLVAIHVAAGSVALVTFWTAGLARKGSPVHKRAGKIYLVAMLGIIATAALMAVIFLARGRTVFGTFLAYLVVITTTACWLAWRAIQLKRARGEYFNRRYALAGGANVVAGLIVFGIGVARGVPLLYLFCWVGVLVGAMMVVHYRRPPQTPNWWLREHYGAMVGNGIATHIAFLSIGLRVPLQALGLPGTQLVPWLLPIVVAALVSIRLNRRYGRRMPALGTRAMQDVTSDGT